MKTYLDCYPCLVRQAVDALHAVGVAESLQKTILKDALQVLINASPSSKPPELSESIQHIIRQHLNNPDPYQSLKARSTQEALLLLPWLQEKINKSSNPLEMAIRLSAAGNIIDFGAASTYNLQSTIEEVIHAQFAIFDLPAFQQALAKADSVLYLADNAGETVFDRLLIQQMQKPTFYVVRSSPVLNDAIREDALSAGVETVATILESGSGTPGINLEGSSPQFRQLFASARLIISKGQGNYEMLNEEMAPIFFLLKVKCQIVAADIVAPMGSFILKQANP